MELINPIVSWAVPPSGAGSIKQLPGATWPKGMQLPQEDDLLTLDFLVDPQTHKPVQVRVAEIWLRWNADHHELAIAVTRPQ